MRSVVGATATFSASSSKRAEAGSSAIHGKRPVVMSGNGRRARGSKDAFRAAGTAAVPGHDHWAFAVDRGRPGLGALAGACRKSGGGADDASHHRGKRHREGPPRAADS